MRAMESSKLLALYERVRRAADLAACPGIPSRGAEVSLCVNVLTQLKNFPVTLRLLADTMVAKKLQPLNRHPMEKIQTVTRDLLDTWKRAITEETTGCKRKASADDAVKNSLNLGCVRIEDGNNATDGQINAQEQTSLAKNVLGNAQCERIWELLIKALSNVADETGEEIRDRVNNSDVVRVAIAVESAIIKTIVPSKRQKCAKARSILFNLQDPKNRDLRRKVLLGEVQPERLAKMTLQEMASDRMQEEYKRIIKATMESSTRHRGHGGPAEATTDQFHCGRCGQRECVYHQMQTRSADEPMTTYVTCVRCQNHWKFS